MPKYVKYIGENRYVGPNRIALETGEVREVHEENENSYVIRGKNGLGFFGWISKNEFVEVK